MTKIEWCQETWNPITGCTPISEGCANCYAKRIANHLRGRYRYPADDPFRVTFHPDRLETPYRWKKPRKVFVVSMGDLFHEDVRFEWIEQVFAAMLDNQQHVFMVLTKRPRTAKMFLDSNLRSDVFKFWPYKNVWLGVTAENQQRADQRIPILLQIPAAVRFVSYEPALGPVDFTRIGGKVSFDSLRAFATKPSLHWIIAGGESGPGARPAYPSWFQSVRDQCHASGVPFFFKQWGESCMGSQLPPDVYQQVDAVHNLGNQPDTFWAVGKKAAGRLLDGVEHNEYPEAL